MDTRGDATPRRKAAAATKVKVVASRYAQAIQKTNLEAKAPTRSAAVATERTASTSRTTVASSSSNAASIKVGSSRAVTAKTTAQTRTGVVSSSARTPAPSTPAVATTSQRSTSTGSSSAEFNGAMSINDKLRLYRANKAAHRSGSAAKANRSSSADADALRTAPRPTLPERITPPTEKAPPRMVSRDRVGGASTPVKRRITTPSTRATPATVNTKPPTTSGVVSSAGATISALRVPTSTTEEELELLECMYLQLCLAEASAAEAFRRQEQSAERQMVTAWDILQSKLQLLHDTTIRLDREVHIRTVESHLDDQAESLVRLGSGITSFGGDLEHISQALQASLQRMPTPGVVCSPPELKRQLEGLASSLETFQKHLQSDGMGSTVADALAFSRGMEESTEQISSLLLQVGHLLEEIQLEVNTETSLKAHSIQDTRVQQQIEETGWW